MAGGYSPRRIYRDVEPASMTGPGGVQAEQAQTQQPEIGRAVEESVAAPAFQGKETVEGRLEF